MEQMPLTVHAYTRCSSLLSHHHMQNHETVDPTMYNFTLSRADAETDTCGGGMYPPEVENWANEQPPLSLQNANFCRAMFGMYIDAQSVVPDVKKTWTKSLLALA